MPTLNVEYPQRFVSWERLSWLLVLTTILLRVLFSLAEIGRHSRRLVLCLTSSPGSRYNTSNPAFSIIAYIYAARYYQQLLVTDFPIPITLLHFRALYFFQYFYYSQVNETLLNFELKIISGQSINRVIKFTKDMCRTYCITTISKSLGTKAVLILFERSDCIKLYPHVIGRHRVLCHSMIFHKIVFFRTI